MKHCQDKITYKSQLNVDYYDCCWHIWIRKQEKQTQFTSVKKPGVKNPSTLFPIFRSCSLLTIKKFGEPGPKIADFIGNCRFLNVQTFRIRSFKLQFRVQSCFVFNCYLHISIRHVFTATYMGSIICIPKDKSILVLEKATEDNTRANRTSLIEAIDFRSFSPRRYLFCVDVGLLLC